MTAGPFLFSPGSPGSGERFRSHALWRDAGTGRDLDIAIVATSHRVRLTHDTMAVTITLDTSIEQARAIGLQLQRAVRATEPREDEPAAEVTAGPAVPEEILTALREVLHLTRHAVERSGLTKASAEPCAKPGASPCGRNRHPRNGRYNERGQHWG